MANIAVGWSFGEDKKKSATSFTPTGEELVEAEKSLSLTLSKAANQSFSYLTGPAYPDFTTNLNSNLKSLDSPDMDLVSLAAESGCSAQDAAKIDSFDEYVRNQSCILLLTLYLSSRLTHVFIATTATSSLFLGKSRVQVCLLRTTRHKT